MLKTLTALMIQLHHQNMTRQLCQRLSDVFGRPRQHCYQRLKKSMLNLTCQILAHNSAPSDLSAPSSLKQTGTVERQQGYSKYLAALETCKLLLSVIPVAAGPMLHKPSSSTQNQISMIAKFQMIPRFSDEFRRFQLNTQASFQAQSDSSALPATTEAGPEH